LKELNVSGCQLTQKAVQKISSQLQEMEILKLRDNSLAEEHCRMIARGLQDAPKLWHLDLSQNFVKDEGACWILASAQ
jgi:Ran GTPase-activating protein (RanGAP) involved in mRNA processing and transport